MPVSRSYTDPCGIARALDRVGERWTLLVVRELLLGPRRFTDLRAGLPTASPNVLSHRLEELQAAGIVARRTLPPPSGATVYELTPWGADLEPVILALARWGSRATPIPPGDLSASALVFALQTTFDAEAAGSSRARLALALDGEAFSAVIARRALSIVRGSCDAPDATIEASTRTLRSAVFQIEPLRELRRDGKVVIGGDATIATTFLGLFRRPTPL